MIQLLELLSRLNCDQLHAGIALEPGRGVDRVHGEAGGTRACGPGFPRAENRS